MDEAIEDVPDNPMQIDTAIVTEGCTASLHFCRAV
jgi:hypothetical protein